MKRTTVLLSLVALQLLQAQPGQLQLTIVNSASFQPGMPHGGSLATIFITPGPTGWPAKPGIYASSTPLAPALQNFQVLVNGAVAPILAVVVPSDPTASAQINIQVPLERNATLGDIMFFNGTCNANIGTGGCGPSPGGYLIVGSATLSPLPNAGLGGFFQDANGFLVAEHASDYSAVTLENPAHAGEQIIAFADDFFPVWPSPPIGVSAPSAYSADPDPPQELVGNGRIFICNNTRPTQPVTMSRNVVEYTPTRQPQRLRSTPKRSRPTQLVLSRSSLRCRPTSSQETGRCSSTMAHALTVEALLARGGPKARSQVRLQSFLLGELPRISALLSVAAIAIEWFSYHGHP